LYGAQFRCSVHLLISLHVAPPSVSRFHQDNTDVAPLVFGRPFVERYALCYQTVVCLFVCDVDVPWPNGWTDQNETWQAGLGPGHIVLDGDPAPLPQKGAEPPIFGPCLLWPNGWMHQDATWYGGRPQPNRLCVRWGPNPLPQKGRSPTQFSAHVYCGQTAAWIKMALGTEAGFGLRDIVFDADPATPRKEGTSAPPNFGLCLLWPNGWMDEDAAWY